MRVVLILVGFFISISSIHAMDHCPSEGKMSDADRDYLFKKLRISSSGKKLVEEYEKRYQSLETLSMYWSRVSYSKITTESKSRSIASISSVNNALGPEVCVYLAQQLPEIENIADLAHELTHATRLSLKFLRGEVKDVEEFVKKRLEADGGEADAFSMECQVKFELLGKWDDLCGPYVKDDHVDRRLVELAFYDGKLSASLTGETYPVLLKRQFQISNK